MSDRPLVFLFKVCRSARRSPAGAAPALPGAPPAAGPPLHLWASPATSVPSLPNRPVPWLRLLRLSLSLYKEGTSWLSGVPEPLMFFRVFSLSVPCLCPASLSSSQDPRGGHRLLTICTPPLCRGLCSPLLTKVCSDGRAVRICVH